MKKIIIYAVSFLLALMPVAAEEIVKVSDADIPNSTSDVRFARIKNYFPGDTVVITNYDRNVSVEVVVLGAIEDNTDISLIISKDTADALDFIQGASYSVKIGKRQQSDKKVKGNAEVTCSSSVEELTNLLKDKEALNKTDKTDVFEEDVPVNIPETDEGKVEETEADKTDEISEEIQFPQVETPEVKEELQETEPVEEVSEIEEPEIADEVKDFSEDSNLVEDVPEVEDVEEVVETPETIEPENESVEELPLETEYISAEEVPEVEEILPVENAETEEESVETEEADSTETVEEIPLESEVESEKYIPENMESVPEVLSDEEETVSEKFTAEEIENLPEEKSEEFSESEFSEPAYVENLAELPEEKPVKAEKYQEEKLDDVQLNPIQEETPQIQEPEYYDAIVLPDPVETKAPVVEIPVEAAEEITVENLVPVSEKEVEVHAVEKTPEVIPDEKETVAEKENLVSVEEEKVSEIASPVETKTEAPVPVVKIEEKTETSVKTEKPFEKFIVKTENLKSEKYYIQIAAYKNEENIMEIVTKYGKKYPLSFVELPENKGYKILVGPLGVDEYKVVLERFKSYGFKDSFVRKIEK